LAHGRWDVRGSLDYSLFDEGAALFFKHALGTVNTTGAGPYTHTITPGNALDGLSLTVQEGIPDQAATPVVNPWTYVGCKVVSLGVTINDTDATLSVGLVGMDKKIAADGGVFVLQTASVPATVSRFLPEHFSLTLDPTGASSEVARCVRSFSMDITNNLDENRYCLGTAIRKEPLQVAGVTREVTGTIQLEWANIADYTRYAAQTITDMTWAVDNGTDSITCTLDVETTGGAKPQIQPNGLIYESLTYRAVGNTADSDALSVVIVDVNAAP
ncbi:MAG: phage tail tube protein, partial [Acidimicrobiia bacterium]|nr:phage tail tube protein [Acidimicrobiia bacterium]